MVHILLCRNLANSILNKCHAKRIRTVFELYLGNILAFIDTFQVLCSPLDSLIINLATNYFKHLSQEFDSKVLSLSLQVLSL